MQFGLFNLMGYRERGVSTSEILAQAAEQTVRAEEADFDTAWFAEHHFSNYCVCPSPLLMVAHCAALTQRIKLGTAVVVVPLYHPARLLAEIGMADSLSNGRLVLGVGSGYQPYEFDRFNENLEQSKEMTEEFLEMLELAFTQETFSYRGQHYQLPETRISAQIAGAMPQVWIAGDNPLIHRMAARRGYVPMLTGRLLGAQYIGSMRAAVEASWVAEGLDAEKMPLGIQRFMCVVNTKAQAQDYADNARHQARLASALRNRAEVVDGAMLVERPSPTEPSMEDILNNILVGDCETIAERLCEEIRQGKPSHMMFHFQVGGSDYRKALASIESFATDIRPLLEKELGPLEQLNDNLP